MYTGKLLPETLAAYVKRARPILLEAAKDKITITYGELLSRLGGPGRRYIGEVVGRISKIDYQNGHPKLSALVVTAATGMVGGGFFGLPGTPENVRRSTREAFQDCNLSEADEQYWQQELMRVYSHPWR